MGLPEGEDREKGTDEIFETIMTENFPKSVVDTNQPIGPGSSESSKWDKGPQETIPRHIILKL